MLRLAIVDDEEIVCKRLSQTLAREGVEVEAFMMARSFLERMVQQPFDIVFLDMRLPDLDGLEVLSRIKSLRQETEVIIVTGHGTVETAIDAIRNGAYHYITKPVNLNEIRLLAKQVQDRISMRLENIRLREDLKVILALPPSSATVRPSRTCSAWSARWRRRTATCLFRVAAARARHWWPAPFTSSVPSVIIPLWPSTAADSRTSLSAVNFSGMSAGLLPE